MKMKNRTSVQDNPEQNGLHTCGRCHRTLPTEAFYVTHSSGQPDCYCKVCRRDISHLQRQNDLAARFMDRKPDYPLVTDMENDRETRMKLIFSSLDHVHALMKRKQDRLKEAEFNAFR